MRCLLLPSGFFLLAGDVDQLDPRLSHKGLDAGVHRPGAAVAQAADVVVEDLADQFADRREHPVLRAQCRLAAVPCRRVAKWSKSVCWSACSRSCGVLPNASIAARSSLLASVARFGLLVVSSGAL